MSLVTTHQWVMSHIPMSHVTHMNEACHDEWGMSLSITRSRFVCRLIVCWRQINSILCTSCHTYEWVTSQHISESWHTYEWVTSQVQMGSPNIWMSHITFYHTMPHRVLFCILLAAGRFGVTDSTCVSHVTHMNESCHTTSMSHGSHTNESLSHGSHMNESQIFTGISHIWMRHVTCYHTSPLRVLFCILLVVDTLNMSELCHTYEWVTPQSTRHVTHMS